MRKSRYSEERIVQILRVTDRDAIADVAKRNGVSEASIYAWQNVLEKWRHVMLSALKHLSQKMYA